MRWSGYLRVRVLRFKDYVVAENRRNLKGFSLMSRLY